MTELKHTPAPWEACNVGDYSDYDGQCRVILGDDLRIAVVLGDHDESAANARLMAAAPDLLGALEEMANICAACTFETIRINGKYLDRKEAVSRARAAIAKVKG